MGAADLWKHTHGDSSIIVAVIDNMFETDHPELDGKQVSNWDVAGFDGEVAIEQGFWMDDESASHGTHVANGGGNVFQWNWLRWSRSRSPAHAHSIGG